MPPSMASSAVRAARNFIGLIAAVAVGCLLPSCDAFRNGDKQGEADDPVQKADYKVELLVARHGLSCTNVVEKWVHKWDFGRGRMADPLLSGAGEHGSQKSSEAVREWLAQNDLQVDAVLSSELLRAQQTALLTWPEAAQTLHIAPFIRETASGSSNFPKEPEEQVMDLSKVMGTGVHINYEWVKLYGGSPGETPGDWGMFLHFLEKSFIPDLIERTQKPAGSRIVLGIVTHSLLMRDSIGECSEHWEKWNTAKPLNNQVLRLEYSFGVSPSKNWPDVDVTPRYKLRRTAEKCGEVAQGLLLKDESDKKIKRLCMSDIGHSCIEPIKMFSLKPDWLWSVTNEHHIIDTAKRWVKENVKVAKLDKELNDVQRILRGSALAPDRQTHYEDSQRQIVKNFNKQIQEEDAVKEELQEQLNGHCWTGGQPNALAFANMLRLQLSPELATLVTPPL